MKTPKPKPVRPARHPRRPKCGRRRPGCGAARARCRSDRGADGADGVGDAARRRASALGTSRALPLLSRPTKERVLLQAELKTLKNASASARRSGDVRAAPAHGEGLASMSGGSSVPVVTMPQHSQVEDVVAADDDGAARQRGARQGQTKTCFSVRHPQAGRWSPARPRWWKRVRPREQVRQHHGLEMAPQRRAQRFAPRKKQARCWSACLLASAATVVVAAVAQK